MIQKGAVAFRRRSERLDQMGELPEVVRVELAKPFELGGLILVMRQGVVGIGDPDLRVGPIADLFPRHERADPRHVSLIRERQQVHHEGGVLPVVPRHPDRLVDDRQLLRLALGHPETALDVANGIEVLIQGRLVVWPHDALETGGLVTDEVEHTTVFPHPRAPDLGIRATTGPEQTLENGPRVVFDGERGGRRAPGYRVEIRTGDPPVAGRAGKAGILHPQLERCELGLFRQLLGRDLIH